MDHNIVKLRIRLASASPRQLLRRLYRSADPFRHAFQSLACRSGRQACRDCHRCSSCPYHAVFGQELSVDAAALRRFQKPPLPFVFDFPAAADHAHGSEQLECGLILVGSAIRHLQDFIGALQAVIRSHDITAECGAVAISGLASIDQAGNAFQIPLTSGQAVVHELAVLDLHGILDMRPLSDSRVSLRFLTPWRLMRQGHLVREFRADTFLRALMRRVSSLMYYYCGWEMEADFKVCSDMAGMIALSAPEFGFCGGDGGAWGQAGITGSGVLLGDVTELLPFLLLGELLHLGKGASFGMGRFELAFSHGIDKENLS